MPYVKTYNRPGLIILKTQAMRTVEVLKALATGYRGTDLQIAKKASSTIARQTTYAVLQRLVEQKIVVEHADRFPKQYSLIPHKAVVISYEKPDGFLKQMTVFTISLP